MVDFFFTEEKYVLFGARNSTVNSDICKRKWPILYDAQDFMADWDTFLVMNKDSIFYDVLIILYGKLRYL